MEHAEGVDGFDLGKVDEVGVEAGNKAADLFSDRHDHLRNKKNRFLLIRTSRVAIKEGTRIWPLPKDLRSGTTSNRNAQHLAKTQELRNGC